MFWVGDSQWGWRKNLKKLPNEFLNGIRDGIPLCCVFIYLVCILLSVLTKKDGIIFEFIYWNEKDWLKWSYWRCPFCKLLNRIVEIKFYEEDTVTYRDRRSEKLISIGKN